MILAIAFGENDKEAVFVFYWAYSQSVKKEKKLH